MSDLKLFIQPQDALVLRPVACKVSSGDQRGRDDQQSKGFHRSSKYAAQRFNSRRRSSGKDTSNWRSSRTDRNHAGGKSGKWPTGPSRLFPIFQATEHPLRLPDSSDLSRADWEQEISARRHAGSVVMLF